MNPSNEVVRRLAADIELLAPAEFRLANADDGVAAGGADANAVGRIVYLLRATAKGTTAAAWAAEALGLMTQRYGRAQALIAPQPSTGPGWEGLAQVVLVNRGMLEPLRVVLTTLLLPDPEDAARQRQLAIVLEMTDSRFNERPMYNRRFVEQRLKVRVAPGPDAAPTPAGAAATVPPPLPTAADGGADDLDHERLALAAQGQRVVIVCIVLGFLLRAGTSQVALAPLVAFALDAALLFYALSGVLKMCSAFSMSKGMKLSMMVLSALPLANLVCWIVLSVRTTALLRGAGYHVGLFGARE